MLRGLQPYATNQPRFCVPSFVHDDCGQRGVESGSIRAAIACRCQRIPWVGFPGSDHGHILAYASKDGKIIWDYDTVQEFKTVNGVKAKGGSINNGGAAIAGGMVFLNSGYSHHSGIIPGNVLLAFSVQ